MACRLYVGASALFVGAMLLDHGYIAAMYAGSAFMLMAFFFIAVDSYSHDH